jgi:hypothetical protein
MGFLHCPDGSSMTACVPIVVSQVAGSTRPFLPNIINDLQTIATVPGFPEALAADTTAHINPTGLVNHILIELSMLGTMKTAAGTQVLKNIIHMPVPTTGICVRQEPGAGCDLVERQYILGLQAKAIDGLAFLRTAEGDAEVLAAVANGANPTVQARAVMAYLSNHGFTSANKAMLAGMLPANRQFLVDRIVKDSNTSADAFNQALSGFYTTHSELAAKPTAP